MEYNPNTMGNIDEQETLESLFIAIGLSEKEARVYRALLTLGEASAATLAGKTGLKRGITYAVLYGLSAVGLVQQGKREGKTVFVAQPPQRLLDMVENRKRDIDTVQAGLSRIMPQLSAQYKLAVGKPTIRYFVGEEGIREVFEDIYAKKDDIVWGCVDFEKSDEAVPSYIVDKLIPKRIKNKLVVHSFFGDSPLTRELQKKDKQSYRKCFLVDKKEYPLPAEIDVYQDKVAMLSFARGEFMGILIENKDFAESLRSIFRLAFGRFDKSAKVKKT